MTGQERILDVYASVATVTGKMVDAARNSEWDRLIALGQDCGALIESLKRVDVGVSISAEYAQRKAGLIRKVLADDAEVRKFTEPWMTQIEVYLGSARQEKMLRRAYASDQSA